MVSTIHGTANDDHDVRTGKKETLTSLHSIFCDCGYFFLFDL
jgi:hypothetical protein